MTMQPKEGYKFIIIDKNTGNVLHARTRSKVSLDDFILREKINIDNVITIKDEAVDEIENPDHLYFETMKYDFTEKTLKDVRKDKYIYKFVDKFNFRGKDIIRKTRTIDFTEELADSEIAALESELGLELDKGYKLKKGRQTKDNKILIKEKNK